MAKARKAIRDIERRLIKAIGSHDEYEALKQDIATHSTAQEKE